MEALSIKSISTLEDDWPARPNIQMLVKSDQRRNLGDSSRRRMLNSSA